MAAQRQPTICKLYWHGNGNGNVDNGNVDVNVNVNGIGASLLFVLFVCCGGLFGKHNKTKNKECTKKHVHRLHFGLSAVDERVPDEGATHEADGVHEAVFVTKDVGRPQDGSVGEVAANCNLTDQLGCVQLRDSFGTGGKG